MVNTDSLRRLSMWMRGRNIDMRVPFECDNPEDAADEIEALRADLKAVAAAGRAVLYHDERGQGVRYGDAMTRLALALARDGVKEILGD